MALTTRKLNHITGKLATIWQTRSQTINLTIKNPDNSTSLLPVSGIFRMQQDLDPSEVRITTTAEIHNADAIAMIKISDVSLAQLRATIYLELAAPLGADAIASRYLITSIAAKGMAPGGDRWILSLDRQRG